MTIQSIIDLISNRRAGANCFVTGRKISCPIILCACDIFANISERNIRGEGFF